MLYVDAYVPVMLIWLAITLVISSVFPLLFAMVRKKSITTTKYAVVCYVVNTLVLFALSRKDKEMFGGVYVGTGIGAVLGNKILKNKGLLIKPQKPDNGKARIQHMPLQRNANRSRRQKPGAKVSEQSWQLGLV